MIIKINKSSFYIILVGFFLVAGIAITIISNPGSEASSSGPAMVNTNSSSANIPNSMAINSTTSRQQTATMGAVTVDVEPKILEVKAEKNIFSVAFNTHSVELDFDFTKIITLKDDLGSTYEALEWTGNSGWHHVSGDIIFPRINESANNVILQINEIEGLTQLFGWEII